MSDRTPIGYTDPSMAVTEARPVCLTVGVTDDDRILAIISLGSPQLGDESIDVLTLETFNAGTEHVVIDAWYEQMMIDRPWETRQ